MKIELLTSDRGAHFAAVHIGMTLNKNCYCNDSVKFLLTIERGEKADLEIIEGLGYELKVLSS